MTFNKYITIDGKKDRPLIQINRFEGQFCIKGNSYADDPRSAFTVFNEYLKEAIEAKKHVYLELK